MTTAEEISKVYEANRELQAQIDHRDATIKQLTDETHDLGERLIAAEEENEALEKRLTELEANNKLPGLVLGQNISEYVLQQLKILAAEEPKKPDNAGDKIADLLSRLLTQINDNQVIMNEKLDRLDRLRGDLFRG